MRIDKYLKVSRLIKRRTVATDACNAGRILVNDKVAKAGAQVKVGDRITINLGSNPMTVVITSIQETARKEQASQMYEVV